MTTVELPQPAPAPAANRRPTPAGTRFVDVRANLMPPEVLSARQVDVVRRRVLISLAALVALLFVGLGASWLQTNSAQGDLDDLNHSIAAQQAQQGSFATLAQAQADAQAAQTQLSTLMTGDLPWRTLLDGLRGAGPAGLTLTNVSGSVTTASGGSAPTTSDPLNTSGKAVVGTLTMSGTARSAGDVATWAQALTKVKGLTSILVTNVGASDGAKSTGVTFSTTASFNSDALGGRHTHSTAQTGGN